MANSPLVAGLFSDQGGLCCLICKDFPQPWLIPVHCLARRLTGSPSFGFGPLSQALHLHLP